jgi:hypothetical protein
MAGPAPPSGGTGLRGERLPHGGFSPPSFSSFTPFSSGGPCGRAGVAPLARTRAAGPARQWLRARAVGGRRGAGWLGGPMGRKWPWAGW